jgi:hypothetical protein
MVAGNFACRKRIEINWNTLYDFWISNQRTSCISNWRYFKCYMSCAVLTAHSHPDSAVSQALLYIC